MIALNPLLQVRSKGLIKGVSKEGSLIRGEIKEQNNPENKTLLTTLS